MGYLERVKETDFTDFKKHASEMTPSEIYEFYDEVFKKMGFFDYTLTNLPYFRDWIVGDVLDVGCNAGGLLEELRKEGYGGRLVGDDICLVALEEALKKGLEVYFGDVEKALPFADRSFDTVICGHTLEHLREPKAAWRELRRVCKDTLIIVIPLQGEDQRWKKTNTHLQFWPSIESFEEWADAISVYSRVEREGTLGVLVFKQPLKGVK